MSEAGLNKFESENKRARFTARGGANSGNIVKNKEIIVAVDTEVGIAKEAVASEIFFQNIEVLLLVGGGNFGDVSERDLIGIISDRTVNRGELGIDSLREVRAGAKKSKAIFGEEKIPREKLVRGDGRRFEKLVTLFEGFLIAREIIGISRV